jgi:alpha-tubulin suppressor-like RCC1 family protein
VADELGQVSVAKTTLAVTNKQEFSVLTPATGLSAPASGNTVCSVQSGSPWCWGNNRTFELGRALVTTLHCESCEPIGTTMMGLQSSGLPVQVSTTLTGVTAIDVGPHHSCALVATGAVYCWGEGQYGQLGQTSRSTANIKFAEGADFSCTLGNLTENCFGGQLEGFLYRSATPLMATGINSATAISVGAYNSCALLADGTVWCWGALKSFMGILGGVTPVQVAGLSEVSSISVGSFHACAMLKSGSIRCWGNGDNGELGNGSTADSMTPVAVSGITNAASVSAGDKSTCAVLADGQVRCWGFRGVSGFATLVTGLMGDGLFGTSPATVPVLVSGITTATAVSVSGSHACAIKSDGSLWCWGFAINAMGTTQLPRVTPVQITTLPAVSAVAVGDYLTCAKLTNGQLQCLGLNTSGQLGSGGEEFLVDDVVQTTPTYSGSITPMEVIGLP